MKKIAILGAVLALSTSALADENAFYAKIGAFGNIGHKLYADGVDVIPNVFKTTSDNNKYGDFAFGGTIGAGYYVMSNLRVGLELSYFGGPKYTYKVSDVTTPPVIAPKTKAELETIASTAKTAYETAKKDYDKKKGDATLKATYEAAETEYNTAQANVTNLKAEDKKDKNKKAEDKPTTTAKEDILVEVTGPAGFLNAYVDVFEAGPAKFYVGGGVGMSYVEVKLTDKNVTKKEVKTKDGTNTTETDVTPSNSWDAKARFAWNIGAGIAFEVSDGVAIDVGYSFVDLGKPGDDEKKKDEDKDKNQPKPKTPKWTGEAIRSHNINLGVRFSL